MSKDVLRVVEAFSAERDLDAEDIFLAMEAMLVAATRKRYGEDWDIRVTIDRSTGDYETYRRWLVVDDEDPEFEGPTRQMLLARAQQVREDVGVGEYIEEGLESIDFGRISAQAAKQHLVQKIREFERAKVAEQYAERIGTLVSGEVKRIDRGNLILDLGNNAEAIVPREWQIPRQPVRPHDRVRGYLKEIRTEVRGPQLFVSRTAPELIMALFELEVPEIGQGLIELKGAARDPGSRAKIAVQAKDRRIDPVGACVGMRGSRVQSVTNELGGERVDIVLWDANPAQFVINAMAPADVESIIVDEDSHAMDIAVIEEKLAQAIGRGGQNVRLASELTGWKLNVLSADDVQRRQDEEATKVLDLFMAQLDVDEELATILVQEGFTTLDEVAYVPVEEMLEIEEFDEDIVEELRSRARDALLTSAIVTAERGDVSPPTDDLLALDGMTPELAEALANAGFPDREDVAEAGVDEIEGVGDLDADAAGKLIMAARAHWFEEEDTASPEKAEN
ncbi:MAG: transcription termination factor NusA [Oceanococcaceae bacterium]